MVSVRRVAPILLLAVMMPAFGAKQDKRVYHFMVEVGAMDDVLSPTAAYEVAISYLVHLVDTGDYSDTTVTKAAGLIAHISKPMQNTDFTLSWRKAVAREYAARALRELVAGHSAAANHASGS